MQEETSTPEVAEETVALTPKATPEEPSTETVETPTEQPLYAGKYNSPEELEKAYKEANTANSKMAQELAESRKPALAPDKQQILDELKAMGVVTQQDLSVQSQTAKDSAEIQSLSLNPQQELILRGYASQKDNLTKSMSACWDEVSGALGSTVVKRKTTIKPKTGTQDQFRPKSAEAVAKLPKDEYEKYWRDFASNSQAE